MGEDWRWRTYRLAEYCARLDAEPIGARPYQEAHVTSGISDIERVVRPTHGGHFAADRVLDVYVADVRASFRAILR